MSYGQFMSPEKISILIRAVRRLATLDLVGVRAAGVYFEDDEWLGTDAATTAFGLGIASFEVAG